MRENHLSTLLTILAGLALLFGGLVSAEMIARAVAPGSPYVRLPALFVTLLPAFLFAEYHGHGAFSHARLAEILLTFVICLAIMAIGESWGMVAHRSTQVFATFFYLNFFNLRRVNLPVARREGGSP